MIVHGPMLLQRELTAVLLGALSLCLPIPLVGVPVNSPAPMTFCCCCCFLGKFCYYPLYSLSLVVVRMNLSSSRDIAYASSTVFKPILGINLSNQATTWFHLYLERLLRHAHVVFVVWGKDLCDAFGPYSSHATLHYVASWLWLCRISDLGLMSADVLQLFQRVPSGPCQQLLMALRSSETLRDTVMSSRISCITDQITDRRSTFSIDVVQ